MPSVSYRSAEFQRDGYTAHTLDFEPLLTDPTAELLCRDEETYTIIVSNNGDTTRLRIESPDNKHHDAQVVAQRLGYRAYVGDQIDIIDLEQQND